MVEFIGEGGFRFEYYTRGTVQLPDASDEVEVVRYPESGLVRVFRKSEFKASLRHCDTDTKPAETSVKQAHHSTTETASASRENLDVTDKAIVAVEGKLIDTANDNSVVGNCKNENNLRRTWNTQTDKILASLHWMTTLYISVTLDSEVSFGRMQCAVSTFIRWVKKRRNFRFGCYFLEPHESGNWHVHLLIYFKSLVPEGVEDAITARWNALNGKPCEEQVKIERVESNEHLLNILWYHKPTRGKKRSRIKFYPLGKHPMGVFGDVQEAKRSVEVFSKVEPQLGKEFPRFRTAMLKYYLNTDELISYYADYIFESRSVELAEPTTSFDDRATKSSGSPPVIDIVEPPETLETVSLDLERCKYRSCVECELRDRCEDFYITVVFCGEQIRLRSQFT